jgi:hypothetical protein
MRYVLIGILAFVGLIAFQTYRNNCYWRGATDLDEWSACILR